MHLGIQFQLSIARDEQNNFIAASVRKSRPKTGVVGFKIYFDFYNNPSYSRILIGSHLWSIRGQTIDDDSARFNFLQIFWILNLNQSQFFAKHSNQSFRFILSRHKITSVLFSCPAFFSYILIFYDIKQIDSMLPCVCSVIDQISDTLGCASCATFLFLPHFDVICDLLLNRRTATWNLFVKLKIVSYRNHSFRYLQGQIFLRNSDF